MYISQVPEMFMRCSLCCLKWRHVTNIYPGLQYFYIIFFKETTLGFYIVGSLIGLITVSKL